MTGLTLTQREQTRLEILNEVLEGHWSIGEVVEVLGVSDRHAWRTPGGIPKGGCRRPRPREPGSLAHERHANLSTRRHLVNWGTHVEMLIELFWAGCPLVRIRVI